MEGLEFTIKILPSARNLVVRLHVTCNQAEIGTIHAIGMNVICPAARPIMNLSDLVNLRVLRRRIGSNPKGASTADLVVGAAAFWKRPAAFSRERAVGRVR